MEQEMIVTRYRLRKIAKEIDSLSFSTDPNTPDYLLLHEYFPGYWERRRKEALIKAKKITRNIRSKPKKKKTEASVYYKDGQLFITS